MQLRDKLAADRQSQPTSFDDRVLIAVQTEERLENMVERFGGNTWPRVGDDRPTRNRRRLCQLRAPAHQPACT